MLVAQLPTRLRQCDCDCEGWKRLREGSLLIEICLQIAQATLTWSSHTRDSLNLFWLIDSVQRAPLLLLYSLFQCSPSASRVVCDGMMMWSEECRWGQVNCDRFSTICKYMQKVISTITESSSRQTSIELICFEATHDYKELEGILLRSSLSN